MRRNAIYFTALAISVMLAGCAKNKTTKGQVTTVADDSLYYTSPSSDEVATAYEPEPTYLAATVPSRSPSQATYAPAPASKYHVVAKRDTLYSLARKYYGNQGKWKDIYEANRSLISNPNSIFVGQKLLIP